MRQQKVNLAQHGSHQDRAILSDAKYKSPLFQHPLRPVVAVCFAALSPALFSTMAQAACPAVPGGSVSVTGPGVTCMLSSGSYSGGIVIDIANSATVQNDGDLNLFISSYSIGRGVRTAGDAQALLNNVTITGGASGGQMYGLHASKGTIHLTGDYSFTGTGGNGVHGIIAGELPGDKGIATIDGLTTITILGGNLGSGILARSTGGTVVTTNGDLRINHAGTSGWGVKATETSTINLNGTNNTIAMTGASGTGVATLNSATINVAHALTVSGTGSGNIGISAGGGTIKLNDTANVTTTSTALLASAGGKLTVLGDLLASTSETGAYGAYATGTGSTITLANADIETTGNSSYGVYASAAGTVTLGGLLSNITTGSSAAGTVSGVYASGASSVINLNSAQTTINTTNGAPSSINSVTGLMADNKGKVTSLAGTDLDITVTGDASGVNRPYGVLANNGTVQLDGNTSITMTGFNNFGARAQNGGQMSLGNVDIDVKQGTGIQSTDAGSVLTLNGAQNDIKIESSTGSISTGLLVSNGGKLIVNSGTNTSIVTVGDSAYGIQMQNAGSSLNFNSGAIVSIDTNGLESHGFYLINGAQRTIDGTNSATGFLPDIVVHGQNSAVLAASGSGSLFTLTGSATLDMDMTQGVDTWGAKADTAGVVTLTGNSTSGGTGLWASNGTLNLSGSASAAGSRVLLDTNGVLNLGSSGRQIGSLEGTAGTRVTLNGNMLRIGSNNGDNDGSMVDGANYAGGFSGTGGLIKEGGLTQTLSGIGNTVSSVDVQGGTLRFTQTSGGSTPTTFRTTGAYTTEGFATTELGANNSVFDIGGTFTQMADSHLKVELGAWLAAGRADIIADKAVLAGDLEITGFTAGALPNRSSVITASDYMLISAKNGITGTYTGANLIGEGSTGLDYLLIDSSKRNGDKELWLGFKLAWTDGGQLYGTGDFTLNAGSSFTVDTVLGNQAGPFDSGWNGQDLTKYGDGVLRLDADNTYTGKTTVNGGVLQALRNDVFADSSDIIVNADGTLDLNGTNQTANRLSNDAAGGGLVTLNGGMLTTDNSSGASVFSGVIANGAIEGGGLIHTRGTLTLTGENTYTGATTNQAGAALNIGNGGASGSLASNSLANAGTLTFNRSDDSAYGGVFSGAGDLIKQGGGVLTLTGVGSEQGNVVVEAGTLRFTENNGLSGVATPFTTSGDYTTKSGATTALGENNSVLDIGGSFTQENNSTLKVELGAYLDSGRADIIADSANLAGMLEITGFTPGSVPNRSSELIGNGYMLIKTTGGAGITGGYDNAHLIGAGSTGLDYLSISSHVEHGTELWLGFGLSWYGGQSDGTGSFTIDNGRFTLDTALVDQTGFTGPGGTSDQGWNGRDLTKNGDGILRLDAVNAYSGKTTVNGGLLQVMNENSLGKDNVFAASSDIIVNANGILDINGTNQTAHRLKNDTPVGGIVTLNGGVLTLDNSTGDSAFSGDITDGDVTGGSLVKTGADALTLSGKTLWTGDTTIEGGALILDGIAGGAQLVSNVIGQTGASLSLVNGATLTGWIDPLVMDISNTSTWNLTGNSVLTSLTQAGTVNFVAPPGGASGVGRTLTVDSLIGQGGTIRLYTVLGADASATDRIVIDGGLASGSTLLDIRNAGGLGAQTMGDGIMVVDAINGTTAAGAFSLSGRVAAGAYDYDLFRTDIQGLGESWYLRSRQTGDKPNYRDEVPVDMAVSVLGNRLALDMLGTYDDRRNGYETDGDFQSGRAGWGRAFGKSSSVSYDDFVKNGPSYDANSGGVQTGMDLYRQTHESGAQDNAGFYLGIGRSEATVDKVNGGGKAGTVDLNGYGLGAYWTHHGADGWYADAVVQGMHYGQTAARSEAGEQLSTNGWGLAASAEGGYPILLAPGWTLTPQLQLVYQRVSFDDGQDQFGRIAIDDSNVVYGRAGAKLGKALDLEDGQRLNVWTRMNVWNAFNDTGTTIFTDVNGNNPTSLSTSLGGQWGEIGVGASGKITRDATLFAGMDYGRALGDGKGDSISARIGVSVLW